MINFDATKYNPEQGIAKHPVGKFPAVISEVKLEGKSETDHHLIVFFTTQAGSIRKQYNIASDSQEDNMKKMVEIARNNLSSLCYATGVFKLGNGQELVNARCQIEVKEQTKNPQYNEVSKVYDANGNEPGKAPVTGARQYGEAPGAVNGGWGQTPQAPPQNAPAPAPAPAAPPAQPAWSPGPSAAPGTPPPWAGR
jgi:hypothetical protein